MTPRAAAELERRLQNPYFKRYYEAGKSLYSIPDAPKWSAGFHGHARRPIDDETEPEGRKERCDLPWRRLLAIYRPIVRRYCYFTEEQTRLHIAEVTEEIASLREVAVSATNMFDRAKARNRRDAQIAHLQRCYASQRANRALDAACEAYVEFLGLPERQ